MLNDATPPSTTLDAVDRVSPTRRPDDRVVMLQNWRHLLFLHWAVPIEELRPHVPPELEIDTFNGLAFVGLVPFTMTGIRPLWAPAVPPISNFHEVNVRTYVHHRGADPGVWFFSLDAASAFAVRIARAMWKLPYHLARMSLEREPEIAGRSSRIRYESARIWTQPLRASCTVDYSPTGPVSPAENGSLEYFLAERYILYARDGKNRLLIGQVHHLPYPLQTATVHSLDENLVLVAGIVRGNEQPLAHYAHGVDVEIFPLKPVVTEGRR